VQQRRGRFELARSGTIFLDEIGEVPIETQLALLRVLQERQFERVGSSRAIPVDVRIIAATNRDLSSAIAAGTFRSDLFYRLNVFPIQVPPLRKRSEDIPLLVEYFVRKFAEKMASYQSDRETNIGVVPGIRLAGQHSGTAEYRREINDFVYGRYVFDR
jgi:transcriptional regulator with GAF, ATPase, and Fis domain